MSRGEALKKHNEVIGEIFFDLEYVHDRDANCDKCLEGGLDQ